MARNTQTANQAANPGTDGRPPENKKVKPLTEKFVPGQTKCRMQGCGHKVMVRSTTKERLESRILRITRYVKCQGPHRHSYTIVEEAKVK